MSSAKSRSTRYVDVDGKAPLATAVRSLASADPDRLAALLAAIGMEVRHAAGYLARGVGAELTLVRATATEPAIKEKLYFLVESVADVCRDAAAAGATVVKGPQQTALGNRAAIQDHDGRLFILTEHRATGPSPESRPMSPANPTTAARNSAVDESEKASSAPMPRSLMQRLRSVDVGLISLFIAILTFIFAVKLYGILAIALRRQGTIDPDRLNIVAWTVGVVWIFGFGVAAFSRMVSLEEPLSDPVRRSLVWQRRSVNVSLIGLIILTLTVVFGVGLYGLTIPHLREAVFDSWGRIFTYVWVAGIAVIVVGRAISLFAAHRNLHRLLLILMLYVEWRGLRFWWYFVERPQHFWFYGVPAYFLSSALFAAYLERAVSVFSLRSVRLTARFATIANLSAFAVQMALIVFEPPRGIPLKRAYMIAYYSALPLAIGAFVLQILLLGQFAKRAKERLEP